MHTEKNKQQRLAVIRRLIAENQISSQEELNRLLIPEDIVLTQATLSRYLKQMKVVKMANALGVYVYVFPQNTLEQDSFVDGKNKNIPVAGFLSIEFSQNLAVIKSLPGYAGSIAAFIDKHIKIEILGTIAGDDTILLIPREGFSKKQVINALSIYFPLALL